MKKRPTQGGPIRFVGGTEHNRFHFLSAWLAVISFDVLPASHHLCKAPTTGPSEPLPIHTQDYYLVELPFEPPVGVGWLPAAVRDERTGHACTFWEYWHQDLPPGDGLAAGGLVRPQHWGPLPDA